MKLSKTDDAQEAHQAYQLGNKFAAQGNMEVAVAHYQRAVALKSDYAEAHNNLGNALAAQGHIDQAVTHLERALSLMPDARVHYNLGNALAIQGEKERAAVHYERALALKPDYPQAHNGIGNALAARGRMEQAAVHYRRALELKPDYAEAQNNLLLTLNYVSSADPVAVYAAHLDFAQRWEMPLRPSIQPHGNDRSRGRRLKIGYVSSDLRRHSVAYFFEPVLENHDRERFEIFCYGNNFRDDEVTERLRSHADHWRQISRQPDDLVATQIRADQIDILIDLNGHTANNCLMVFARKPAPIQLTWLGYPNTTGLTAMDYRLTDGYADPVGLAEQFHSEKLVRLPECFCCYKPPEDAPVVSETPAREQGYITFGTFNHHAKINPEVMAVWARILQDVPDSRLVLKNVGLAAQAMQRRVRELFAGLGIAPQRLELFGHDQSRETHLQRYRYVDIGLDPFPYNGTTTTCEALWMGVPVVTLAGRTHAGRVGVSLLSNLGMTELICRTQEEYIATATRLAANLEHLSALRKKLRPCMTVSPLLNASRFTTCLEREYFAMWDDYVGIRGIKNMRP